MGWFGISPIEQQKKKLNALKKKSELRKAIVTPTQSIQSGQSSQGSKSWFGYTSSSAKPSTPVTNKNKYKYIDAMMPTLYLNMAGINKLKSSKAALESEKKKPTLLRNTKQYIQTKINELNTEIQKRETKKENKLKSEKKRIAQELVYRIGKKNEIFTDLFTSTSTSTSPKFSNFVNKYTDSSVAKNRRRSIKDLRISGTNAIKENNSLKKTFANVETAVRIAYVESKIKKDENDFKKYLYKKDNSGNIIEENTVDSNLINSDDYNITDLKIAKTTLELILGIGIKNKSEFTIRREYSHIYGKLKNITNGTNDTAKTTAIKTSVFNSSVSDISIKNSKFYLPLYMKYLHLLRKKYETMYNVVNDLFNNKNKYYITYLNTLITFLINTYTNTNTNSNITFDKFNGSSDDDKFKKFYIFLYFLSKFMKLENIIIKDEGGTEINIEIINKNSKTYEELQNIIQNVRDSLSSNYKYVNTNGSYNKPSNDDLFMKHIINVDKILINVIVKIGTLISTTAASTPATSTTPTSTTAASTPATSTPATTQIAYDLDITNTALENTLKNITNQYESIIINNYKRELVNFKNAETAYNTFMITAIRKPTNIDIGSGERLPESVSGRIWGSVKNTFRGNRANKYKSISFVNNDINRSNYKKSVNAELQKLKTLKESVATKLTSAKQGLNISTSNIETTNIIPTKANKKLSTLQNYAKNVIDSKKNKMTNSNYKTLEANIQKVMILYQEIKTNAKNALNALKTNVNNKVNKAKRVQNVYKHTVPNEIKELISSGEAFSSAIDTAVTEINKNAATLLNVINKISTLKTTKNDYNTKTSNFMKTTKLASTPTLNDVLLEKLKDRAKAALADLVDKLVTKVSTYTNTSIKNITKTPTTGKTMVGNIKAAYQQQTVTAAKETAVKTYVDAVEAIVQKLKTYYNTNVNTMTFDNNKSINKTISNLYKLNHTNLNNGSNNAKSSQQSKTLKTLKTTANA